MTPNDPTAPRRPRHAHTDPAPATDPTDSVSGDGSAATVLPHRRPGRHLHPALSPEPLQVATTDVDLIRRVLTALQHA